ncbi:MAG: polymerase sigma-70 factor, subfamily [Frankiales bacterium]|nr:polymerase sigma-70 factor, subfamily [Frankiales bacterium]
MTPDDAVAEAFRTERARVLATLIRLTGDWDLAEECVQDAFERALKRWPVDGVPRKPGAWLTTTARNRALDRLRRSTVEAGKLREAAEMPPPEDDDWPDDRLRLIFTCCHPALALEARVALTLRTVAGLTTDEIARAFLTPTATMAQRLVRAQRKIREAGIPYRVPPPELLPQRTTGVLAVVYLLFNEGYSAAQRWDLAAEAIRLGRILVQLMPDDVEVRGLLALMLLQDARRAARLDAQGDLMTLEDQDRSLWDRGQIAEGVRLLAPGGPYQLQAAIAACHVTAARVEDTDWTRIASCYDELARLTASPFVELNRAIAVAMADGPAVGLPLVDALDRSGALAGYHLLAATQADLLRRLGRRTEAAAAYERALDLAPTEAERRYLQRRIDEL